MTHWDILRFFFVGNHVYGVNELYKINLCVIETAFYAYRSEGKKNVPTIWDYLDESMALDQLLREHISRRGNKSVALCEQSVLFEINEASKKERN